MLSGSFSRRAYGALLLVFGLIAIVTPFSSGGWAISIPALIVLVAGAVGIIQGPRTQSPSSTWTTYLRRAHDPWRIAAFRPASHGDWRAAGTLALITAADGVTKIVSALRDKLGPAR